MSSMDALRRQLTEVQGALKDVVGRLDALEGQALTAQTKPLAAITPTETKSQHTASTATSTRKP
jgi:hypothetical protein